MNRRIFMNHFRLVCVFVCVFISASLVRAQQAKLQPQPFYDQCRSLVSGTSSDDATSRAITSLKDQDPKVRIPAAQVLSQSCDKRAIEPLTDLLQDQDPMVRIAAVEALGKLGDPESVRSMSEIITDKDWGVRMALVRSLGSFKMSLARGLVLNGIANPSGAEITDPDDMRVRCTAILTVNQFTDVVYSRKAVFFLYTFLRSKYEPIRRLAEETMFALKDTRNGPTEFIAILKQNDNPELRRWAAYWIGRAGIEKGREALTEAATKDRDEIVKKAAVEAIKALDNAKGT